MPSHAVSFCLIRIQHIAREDVQHAFVEVVELLDPASFHQVPEKIVLGCRGFPRFRLS